MFQEKVYTVVYIIGRHIAQSFIIALRVMVHDESFNLLLQLLRRFPYHQVRILRLKSSRTEIR
jgi:hypothetical protein